MIERFFYKGCENETLFEELKNSPTFALVREMNFKYGLKILLRTNVVDAQTLKNTPAYQMVNEDGIAVCKLYTVPDGGEKGDTLEYCYRSPYFRKQRGTNNADKETLRSNKISSLMASLKRQSVVKERVEMTATKTRMVGSAMQEVQSKLGNSNKYHSLSPDQVQALLAHYLGVTTDQKLVDLDANKCKIELDKLNEADRLKELKTQEVNRLFTNPYYQMGVDEFGHLLVGKFKVENINHSDRTCNVSMVEPFKRYINPTDCAELVPLITMTKLAYEGKNEHRMMNFIPIMDGYDANLDAVFYYTSTPTHYDHVWMFTPAGEA